MKVQPWLMEDTVLASETGHVGHALCSFSTLWILFSASDPELFRAGAASPCASPCTLTLYIEAFLS